MMIRILSSIIGLPIAFIILFKGGIYLKLGVMFVSFVGLYEFYLAVCKKISFIHIFGFLFSAAYLLVLNTSLINFLDLIFLVLLCIFFLSLVFFHQKLSVFDLSITLFGFFYITFMFSNIYLTRLSENGNFLVWLPFFCAWLSDTGAYFLGISFGKHKLTPVLSPKKTVEGAIGGVALATLGTGLYGFLVSNYLGFVSIKNFAVFCTIIGFFGSIFAQFGDLTASSIKRKFNIKDYGKIIPGHGGILDRFDSVIFTSAVVYIFTKLIQL